MLKHKQDGVQPLQPLGFPCEEGPETICTNNETLYEHFKTWKQRCELMLGTQLSLITETQKVNKC